MSNWQNIDTAPKDGKDRVDLGAFVGNQQKWLRVPDCYWHRKAKQWMTKHYDKDGYSALRAPFYPTHWMLRPEPPKAGNDD